MLDWRGIPRRAAFHRDAQKVKATRALHCNTATRPVVPRRSARRPAMVPPRGCRQDTCVKSDKAYKAACQITRSRRQKYNNPLYSITCTESPGLASKLLTIP